jgi:hypothetical protein
LLNAISDDGLDVLESLGFDLCNTSDDAHDVALKHLKSYYDKEENFHVACRSKQQQ